MKVNVLGKTNSIFGQKRAVCIFSPIFSAKLFFNHYIGPSFNLTHILLSLPAQSTLKDNDPNCDQQKRSEINNISEMLQNVG
jgi:hypothetical protein